MTTKAAPSHLDDAGFAPITWRDASTVYVSEHATNAHAGVARPRPSRHRGYTSSPHPPAFGAVEALAAVGIVVPDEVAEGLQRYRSLRSQMAQPAPPPLREQIEAQLAAGELTPSEADTRLLKVAGRRPHPDYPRAASFRAAADSAYFAAHAALAALGDDLIAGPLQDLCDELLSDPASAGAEERWGQLWAATGALRNQAFFASTVTGASRAEQVYRYPHRAREWRLGQVRARERHAIEARTTRRRGRHTAVSEHVALRLRERTRDIQPASLPVAAAHRDEWGARLWSADQIAEHLQRIIAAERACLAD